LTGAPCYTNLLRRCGLPEVASRTTRQESFLRLDSSPVVATLLAITVAIVGVPASAPAADHLLISEFAVRPTDAEFVEIYNPTAETVVLSDYYISDYRYSGGDGTENYWRITDGALIPEPGFLIDFMARFPAGATIAPGGSLVIALHDDAAFLSYWQGTGTEAAAPDYELQDDGSADGVPGLVDPGPEIIGQPLIQSEAGLSNSGELVVLFRWDGLSDLVEDVDIVQWGVNGPDYVTISPNKTGVSVDGPDPDNVPSTYLPDTEPALQDLASTEAGTHDFGRTVSRVDFSEGLETPAGGNGITGHDETSENYSSTWATNTLPSFGSPGEFGPPAMVAARAVAESEVEVVFSRALDPVTADAAAAYTLLQIQTPAGAITSVPATVQAARLLADGLVVRLTTEPLTPLAFYELRAAGILAADLSVELVPGSRLFFRGFNPGPGLELAVPRRPFVPHLDGQMEIRYVAPQGRNVLLRVFDVEGRELFVLADEVAPAGGLRTIHWDGRDDLRQRLPAGVYILHLEIPGTGDETTAPLVVGAAAEGTLR